MEQAHISSVESLIKNKSKGEIAFYLSKATVKLHFEGDIQQTHLAALIVYDAYNCFTLSNGLTDKQNTEAAYLWGNKFRTQFLKSFVKKIRITFVKVR
jgi:hypothetical protein